MRYQFQIQDFNMFRLIRINNTNKVSTQIWELLKTASIKVMAGGKHSFHMCATQNLHIWPPLFSSRLSFRAHVIEKPPASAKKAHSGKFFLKQPTSQLWAVFWLSACQDSDSLPFFPLSPPPPLLTKPPPKKEEKEDLPLDEGKNVSAAHLQLLPSSSPSLAAFLWVSSVSPPATKRGQRLTLGRTPAGFLRENITGWQMEEKKNLD